MQLHQGYAKLSRVCSRKRARYLLIISGVLLLSASRDRTRSVRRLLSKSYPMLFQRQRPGL